MASCNSCGKFMTPTENVYRREIYSGQTKRVNYGKRITFGNSTHHAVRNVCYVCAKEIDDSRERGKRNSMILFLTLAIGAFLYYIIKH